MVTKESVPSKAALSEKQGEGYQLRSEVEGIEPLLKGARTRLRKAEYEVERDQLILTHNKDLSPEDRATWEGHLKRDEEIVARRQAKVDEYQTRLDELTDRINIVRGEITELTATVREESQAQRARQAEEANAVVEAVILNHPLAKEHGLRSQVSGSSVEVGWDEEYEGRDGKTYTRGTDVTVDFPHAWFDDEVKPAQVRWSTFSSPGPDAMRYGAAMMVAHAVAIALDKAGITDRTW